MEWQGVLAAHGRRSWGGMLDTVTATRSKASDVSERLILNRQGPWKSASTGFKFHDPEREKGQPPPLQDREGEKLRALPSPTRRYGVSGTGELKAPHKT